MNEIIPKSPISIRPAAAEDLAFIDGLQKKHSKNVGWMQTMALEKKIADGQVIVAWASRPCLALEEENMGGTPMPQQEEPIGYCIGTDRYFKHDDIGIIYQMNVVPGKQRGLVGASLLKAQFERSAYGCRLYCCWCAQDIEANRFWEAMGFVALAFRAGSEKKGRVHIFWQRRIRSGDVSTPYWFPSQTTGGSIREDRLVLPIPPGTHWSEVKGMVLPGVERPEKKRLAGASPKVLPPTTRHVQFGRPSEGPEVVACPERSRGEKVKACPERSRREKKPKRKNDPKMVAAARELRDVWLERVNAPGGEKLLVGNGKYDVARPALSATRLSSSKSVEGALTASVVEMKQLAA